MTLSNIFIGKKVVKQAYLNNALIYQSKGWETLPSTCQEVWTKTYPNIYSSIYPITCDKDNNTYFISNYFLYKISPDGSLVWQPIELAKQGTNSGYSYSFSSITVINNLTYLLVKKSYNRTVEQSNIIIFDENGMQIQNVDTSTINPAVSKVSGFKFDGKNIYFYGEKSVAKLDFNLKLLDLKLLDSYTFTNTINSIDFDNNFVYVLTGYDFWILEKDNFKAQRYIKTTGPFDFKVDSIGHVYCRDQSVIYKYDVNTCQLLQTIYLDGRNTSISIQLDSQDNLYLLYWLDESGQPTNKEYCYLTKYSSDSTKIWSIKTSGMGYDNKIWLDNNDNIYLTIGEEQSQDHITIKKLMNLVKEN